MKKIVYKALMFEDIFNEETRELERKEVLCTVEAGYCEEALDVAKHQAYNGEYTIEEDGIEGAMQQT